MNIEQYQPNKTRPFQVVATLSLAAVLAAGSTGCRGTAPAFSQAFSGLTAPARVPPPAQGSFQVPGSYSGGVNGAGNPSSSGLGGSSFGSGPKTSQNTLPTGNLVNSISNAQSQLLTATNKARNSVNRAADGINSSVEQASARVDRLGQGVAQAGAILSEAATTPIVSGASERSNMNYPTSDPPSIISSNSGRIGDAEPSETASWRTPVPR